MHSSTIRLLLEFGGSELVAFVLFVAIAGWPRGIDRTLVTTKGEAAYRASLRAVARGATKRQVAALEWAIAGLDLESIRARYPDRTGREIVRSAVADALAELQSRSDCVSDMNCERLQEIRDRRTAFTLDQAKQYEDI